jgi:hypothetical protein
MIVYRIFRRDDKFAVAAQVMRALGSLSKDLVQHKNNDLNHESCTQYEQFNAARCPHRYPGILKTIEESTLSESESESSLESDIGEFDSAGIALKQQSEMYRPNPLLYRYGTEALYIKETISLASRLHQALTRGRTIKISEHMNTIALNKSAWRKMLLTISTAQRRASLYCRLYGREQ